MSVTFSENIGLRIYAYQHHVRLLPSEPVVVMQPQSTRSREPTLLCNQVPCTQINLGDNPVYQAQLWSRCLRSTGPELPKRDNGSTHCQKATDEEREKVSISVVWVCCRRSEMPPEVTADKKATES